MSQVIIVSNRLPVSVKKADGKLVYSPSVGGLATGLSSYAKDKNNTWIGWPGIASDDLTKAEKEEIVTELAKHRCAPVFLTRKQIDSFYNGYSNTVLWPLFHELRPQDRPGPKRNAWFKTYRDVNRLFAETVEVAAQRGAYVWVHDYQLLLMPAMLRKLGVEATIGFFLHIPFPSSKKFGSLADGKRLLDGMLGADLIGFHTPRYVEQFLLACGAAGYATSSATVTSGGRAVNVADFPMGIDYDKYASSGRSTLVRRITKQYKRRYKGTKTIVAVDRLDPSKGLLERLEAYGEFLERYPDVRGKVRLVMVASPSRTDIPAYARLSRRMDALVNDINERYGDDSWMPVDYINETLPFEHVTALFQIADVAFIAPLRDGMNLAAKEFVASTHKNSVLILSETAGAALELHDALIVDPKRPETVIAALHDALTMSGSELRGRLRRMKRHLKRHTVQAWAKDFIGSLNRTLVMPQPLVGASQLDADALVADFAGSSKRLLLLDYDGTLVPFHANPEKANPPKDLQKALGVLARDPANDIVIISGRSAQDLVQRFGKLPINLVAEHGVSVRRAGQSTWKTRSGLDSRWKKILLPVLEKYAAMAPGVHVEEKPHSLAWHYRAASPYYAHKYRVVVTRIIKPFLKENGLVLLKGNKVLEIRDTSITKGTAAREWLTGRYDFVLAAGDDTTDEDMFKELPSTAYGIRVGGGLTVARYRADDSETVRSLLKRLASVRRS